MRQRPLRTHRAQIQTRRANITQTALRIHRVRRTHTPAHTARLHLHKAQHAPLARHDVNLPTAIPVVPAQHLHTYLTQRPTAQTLPQTTQRQMTRTAPKHPTPHHPHTPHLPTQPAYGSPD